MLDKDTKTTIQNARDVLVGKVPNPVSQIDLITTAMIYKFMDDMDLENIEFGGKRVFFTGDLEPYAWSKLMNPKLGHYMRISLYAKALDELQVAKQIPELFRKIFKNAFLPFRDGATLSLFLNEINQLKYDNSENLGDAFEFLLEEEFRPGEYFEVLEDEHGGYILNSKDMCLIPRLPDLLSIGMDSLKVEGRNKTEYYAAIVARTYRQAIDDWYQNPQQWDYQKYMPDLYTLQNRGYCLGFHDGKLTNISQNYEYTRTLGEWLFAGSIVEWQGDDAIFEIRNYIDSGEFIEFLIPHNMENLRLCLTEFEDATSGEITPKVSAGQNKRIRIRPQQWPLPLEEIKQKLPQYVIARKLNHLPAEQQTMLDHKKEEYQQLCKA